MVLGLDRAVSLLADRGVTVTVDDIRAASRAGAPGFMASGRIDLDLLAPWLKANADKLKPERESKLELDRQIAEQKLADLKREAGIADETLILRSDVARMAVRYLGSVSPMLDQKLVNILPAQAVGMSVEEIRKQGREIAESIKAKMRDFAKAFEC